MQLESFVCLVRVLWTLFGHLFESLCRLGAREQIKQQIDTQLAVGEARLVGWQPGRQAGNSAGSGAGRDEQSRKINLIHRRGLSVHRSVCLCVRLSEKKTHLGLRI